MALPCPRRAFFARREAITTLSKKQLRPQEANILRKQKKLRKRAVRLRNQERDRHGHAAPLSDWIKRIDGLSGDLTDGFTCSHCGQHVPWNGGGTRHRNHCPHCLHSIHLDTVPGDRAADCGGIMEPLAIWSREEGEWALIHRCIVCGTLSSNRIAADDSAPLLVQVAQRPLLNPPFPIDGEPSVISDNDHS